MFLSQSMIKPVLLGPGHVVITWQLFNMLIEGPHLRPVPSEYLSRKPVPGRVQSSLSGLVRQ